MLAWGGGFGGQPRTFKYALFDDCHEAIIPNLKKRVESMLDTYHRAFAQRAPYRGGDERVQRLGGRLS